MIKRRDFIKMLGLGAAGWAMSERVLSAKTDSIAIGKTSSRLKAGAATRMVNPKKPASPSGHGSRMRIASLRNYQ